VPATTTFLREPRSFRNGRARPGLADVEGQTTAGPRRPFLAALAFGSDIVDADVHREGISALSAADIAYASRWATPSSSWRSPTD